MSIVRGFRPGDAFDGALAEPLGLLGKPLLRRISGERAEHSAIARQERSRVSIPDQPL